jgi:NADH dehydrogenase
LPTVVITGAFSYTGKYTTRLLLERGCRIRTLTNHPQRKNPFGAQVEVHPYAFDRPERLAESLRGADTLINTYWVRFPYRGVTYETAVHNTRILIAAARDAGIRRVVHVSIANPSLESPLGYYRGKAQLEESIRQSGLSYAILRPTVIFGSEDILINNIAWFVRRFPIVGIPGDGRYGIQPIYVEDMAALLADAVLSEVRFTRDAAGPEAYTFEELVRLIAASIGRNARTVHFPVPMAYLATWSVGRWLGDVVLTRDEYRGLMSNLLVSSEPPAGTTSLRAWLAKNRDNVGLRYASELHRHFRS